MFSFHLSTISISRSEPDASYDFVKRQKRLNQFFEKMAEKIVLADAIHNPITNKKKINNLKNIIEMDERKKTTLEFMDSWNYWREFYFQLPEIEPKTKGQLTAIENAIQFCNDNNYDVHMMIGCLHYAYQKRKFKPSYSSLISYGQEVYQYYDNVVSDLDKKDYQTQSMERFI